MYCITRILSFVFVLCSHEFVYGLKSTIARYQHSAFSRVAQRMVAALAHNRVMTVTKRVRHSDEIEREF